MAEQLLKFVNLAKAMPDKREADLRRADFQEIFERFLAQRKIQRRVVLLTPHFLSLPIIISCSDLVATVPQIIGSYCASIGANVRSVALPFEVPRIPVMQHWHRKFHNDARNKWLRATMRELFSSEPDE